MNLVQEQIFSMLMGISIAILFFVAPVIIQVQIKQTNKVQQLKTKIAEMERKADSMQVEYKQLKHYSRQYHPNTMWLARAIYSETDNVFEMEHLAWVIRNRVAMRYNGKTHYRDVVLDPYQFSAFNPGSRYRWKYATKSWYSQFDTTDAAIRWSIALNIAKRVAFADDDERPKEFDRGGRTLYFYSERSMPRWKPHPDWRYVFDEVKVESIEDRRFRFFADMDYDPGSYVPDVARTPGMNEQVLSAR